jgi:phage tail protein X
MAGDTWDSIAYEVYGDELRMTELLAANLELQGIVVFDAGVTVECPEISTPAASTLPPWKQ